MDDIEKYICQYYGLQTLRRSSIGNKVNLFAFVGNYRMGNTAIESIDLYGLHNYLTNIGLQNKNLNVYWAIVKADRLKKDCIFVSLIDRMSEKLSLRDTVFSKGDGKAQQETSISSPCESALSKSLLKQGIANDTALGKYLYKRVIDYWILFVSQIVANNFCFLLQSCRLALPLEMRGSSPSIYRPTGTFAS